MDLKKPTKGIHSLGDAATSDFDVSAPTPTPPATEEKAAHTVNPLGNVEDTMSPSPPTILYYNVGTRDAPEMISYPKPDEGYGGSTKRILKEIYWLRQQPLPDDILSCAPTDPANIYHWTGAILGPEGSPYEGGVFPFSIKFPKEYPFRYPYLKFLVPIHHPQVGLGSGTICYYGLQDSWSPVMKLHTVFRELTWLLKDPSSEGPMRPEVAYQLQRDREGFWKEALEMTKKHATPSPTTPSPLEPLLTMNESG